MEGIPAEVLEEASPHTDIHLLFQHYNSVYFDNALGATRVEWSSARMTSCAGTCARTEWGDCVIRLSKPILVLRPEEDLKNTLLHEMIHAYIMLHRIPGAGKDGHGAPFKAKMALINAAEVPDIHRPPAGYKITVYHTMLDEVRHYQQHWWQCQRCSMIKRRAMNRRPQPADCLTRQGDACQHLKCSYHVHERTCGGEYVKIKEPEPKPKAPRKSKPGSKAPPASRTIAAAFAQVKTEPGSKLASGTDPTSSAAVAVAALEGSIRRRPTTAAAQPLIAQFAQMAPRKPGAARGAALVDLTSDGSDDDLGAAALARAPSTAAAQLRGNTGAHPQHGDAIIRGPGSAHVLEDDVQQTDGAAAEPDGDGADGASGHARQGRASRAGSGRGSGPQAGRASGKRRRLEEGAAHAQEVSSDGAAVVVVDDPEAAQAVAESAEDADRRRRRALCAAAAERRHSEAAAATADGATENRERNGPL